MTADWIFDVLGNSLSDQATIQMVDFGGPTGSEEFNDKYNSTLIDASSIKDYPRGQNDACSSSSTT